MVIDIWELWSKKADIEIEFVQLDIKAGMEQIVSGEIDIIEDCYIVKSGQNI